MINLKSGILKDKVGLCIAQLESPFFHELTKGKLSEKDILFWKNTDIRKRKIYDLTEEIINKYKDLNLIVFPEYSIPSENEIMDYLQNKSNNNNIIIIGGSSYNTDYFKNICPIFIPNEKPYYLVKDGQAPLESDIYFDAEEIDKPHYFHKKIELTWSHNNANFSIEIFICMDFLNSVPDINEHTPGIIVSPLCSPHIDSFYGLSEFYIRKKQPKFIVLANTVASNKSKEKMVGCSGISCSSIGTTLNKKLNNTEQILYAKLNLTNARVQKPTIIGTTNPISNLSIQPITLQDNRYCLGETCLPDFKDRPVINPDIFRAIGKKLRIFYLTCDHYAEIFEKLKVCPSYTASVLGNVDIIIRNINDAATKARLYDFYNVAHIFNEKDWNYFSVNKFFKYDGVDILNRVNVVENPPSRHDLEKIVALTSSNKENYPSPDEIELFYENNWLIGNIEECLKENNIRAIVNIFLPDIAPTNDVSIRFENEVIDKYLDNDSITGIYEGTSKGLQTNYVFEFCSQIVDLFSIVESLHEICRKKNIKITTKTNLISQKISTNLYASLSIPSVQYEISSIVDSYMIKDYGIDFCLELRKQDSTKQTEVVNLYNKLKNYKTKVSKLERAERKVIQKKIHILIDYISSSQEAFCKLLLYNKELDKASSAYLNLVKIIEKCLRESLISIRDYYYNKNDSDLIRCNEIEKEYRPHSNKKEIDKLTLSELLKLSYGLLLIKKGTEFMPFTNGNKEEIDSKTIKEMVKYRNMLVHYKDDVHDINVKNWIDNLIWLISIITSDNDRILNIISVINIPALNGKRD